LTDDRLHSSEFFRAKTLPWLLRIISSTTPAEFPDFGFLDPRDKWGPAVIGLAHVSPDPTAAAQLLLHACSARGAKASRAWWATTEALVRQHDSFAEVILTCLDAVTTVDTTPRDRERCGWDVPDPFLLSSGNELVARGLAWAVRILDPPDDTYEVLGRVILRASTMVWVVPAHRMLCPKLASAAVDTLIALDAPAACDQLSTIIDEIRVPALIRRIGAHLDIGARRVESLVADLRKRGPLPRPDRRG
jgi:hypothetical protein